MAGTNSTYVWSAIDRITVTALSLTGNIVLANLLTKSDFGLVGIVMIFSSLANSFSNCGLADGLIRLNNPSEKDYSTVFVYNAVCGTFFGILFYITAPYIAQFFGQEELIGIVRVMGIVVFLSALTLVQETRLRKSLDMKRIAIIKISATVSAVATGIVMAMNGGGYWSLVFTRILAPAYMFVFYILLSKWKFYYRFYKDSFKGLFNFGYHLLITYIINQIGRNINSFVLGKVSGATETGIYSQAQKMQEVPCGVLESIFNWSFYPILANESDESQRKVLIARMFSTIVFFNAIILLGMLIISAPAFGILFDHKWDESVPLFRLLLIIGLLYSIQYFIQTILKVYNRADRIQNLTIAERIIQLSLLLFSFRYGVIAIIASQILAVSIITLVYIYDLSRLGQLRITEIIKGFFKPLLLPVIAAIPGIIYMSQTKIVFNDITAIVSVGGIFVALLALFCEIIRPQEYISIKHTLQNMRKR